MRMLCASIPLEGTTVCASQATQGTELRAKRFAKMAVGTEALVLQLMCVPARKASLGPAVRQVRISFCLLQNELGC